jgi:hypothetical protein
MIRAARAPLLWFVAALMVFCAVAGSRVTGPGPNNHFAHLADSYLHGTLQMQAPPPHGNDWASVTHLTLASGQELDGLWWDQREREFMDLQGNLYAIDAHDMRGADQSRTYYVSFPPLPAVLMMPGVAIFGLQFWDTLFVLCFAAANVSLCFVLLRHLKRLSLTSLSDADLHWLTAMFGFGTAHMWCAVQGAVWFAALIIGTTFSLLYARVAIDARQPMLAGAMLALAFATRTPLLFSVVFFSLFFFFPKGERRREWGRPFWLDVLKFGAAPLLVGCSLLLANHARFESLSEFGHSYLAAGQIDRIKHFGLFNVHFVSRNLACMFAQVPQFLPEAPYLRVSNHGLALWFTTPALLWLLLQERAKSTRDKHFRLAIWVTIAAIAVPHIFYQNTGWVQFGYRFSLDYLPYLVMALAVGRTRLSLGFKLAILVGIAVNMFGAVTFDRMPQFYGEWLLEP